MTKQEFESRIKSNVSDSLFEEWNRVYMAAGQEIDKDVFCAAVKTSKGNPELMNVMISLRNQVERKDMKIQNLNHDIEMLNDEKNELKETAAKLKADFISTDNELKEAAVQRNRLVIELLEKGLDEEAISIVGHGYVIATKASTGMAFTQVDLDYLADTFSKKQVNP